MSSPPLPQDIDDEQLSATEEGRQPEMLPSRLASALYWLHLVPILEEMREMRLKPRTSSGQTHHGIGLLGPDPGAILRLNSRIEDAIQGIPPHLRPDTNHMMMGFSEEQAAVFRYQGRVLRTRYDSLLADFWNRS